MLVISGPSIVKSIPLLSFPSTVTTTFPVAAPFGIDVLITVSLHAVAVAVTPLNFNVLVPCEFPNPFPFISIIVPAVPRSGINLFITSSPHK